MYNDPDICADETKKLLKHIFKYLIIENPDLCMHNQFVDNLEVFYADQIVK